MKANGLSLAAILAEAHRRSTVRDRVRESRRGGICVYFRLTRWPASYASGVTPAAQAARAPLQARPSATDKFYSLVLFTVAATHPRWADIASGPCPLESAVF